MSVQQHPPFPTSGHRWHKRLAELGVRWRLLIEEQDSPEQASIALKERIKELNCLYAISQLIEREHCPLDEFLAMVVDVLPPSWQYPEIACARIVLNGRNYDSLYFQSSPWFLSSPIHVQGRLAGQVSVHYTEPSADQDEGPFLREERHLLDAAAGRIGHTVSRKLAENGLEESHRQLAIERAALREANLTLRTVLARIEDEKSEIHQNIVENVRKILMPTVRELSLMVPPDQQEYLALLEENLTQITSPFVRRLSLAYQSLTTTEIQICHLIRDGLGSKEIADSRGVSVSTISRHREHIRQKLGIANSKVNLATYLQSTM